MKKPLREQGRYQHHPQEEILESVRGVEYEYYYTGKRLGSSGMIELHVTSQVTDWAENRYLRKAWFMGDKKQWKRCIENHVRNHLTELGIGIMMVRRLLNDFEVSEDHFVKWEKYNPIEYR